MNPASVKSNSKDYFKCDHCTGKFSHRRNLKYHIRQKHPSKVKIDPCLFQCKYCAKGCSNQRNLNYHLKKHHKTVTLSKIVLRCPSCQEDMPKKDLLKHIENHHDIKLEYEPLDFSTYKEFKEWKEKTESDTKSKFVKSSGAKTTPTGKISWYRCHRSGKYVSKSTGKRHLKLNGSYKINAFCPAQIRVEQCKDNSCKVQYLSTHFGHAKDLKHLPLNASERCSLASKIAVKMPFKDILCERFTPDNSSRLDIITRKDLHNIRKAYNIGCEARRNENEVLSLDSCVQDNICEQKVLTHKPRGEMSKEYPQLKKDSETDFETRQTEVQTLEDVSLSLQKAKEIEFENFKKDFDKISTFEELQIWKKTIMELRAKINALKIKKKNKILIPKAKVNTNKKIDKQMHFVAAKQKNKKKISEEN